MEFVNAQEAKDYLVFEVGIDPIKCIPTLIEGNSWTLFVFEKEQMATLAQSALYTHSRWPKGKVIGFKPHFSGGFQLSVPLTPTRKIFQEYFTAQDRENFRMCQDIIDNYPNAPIPGRNFMTLLNKAAVALGFDDWADEWRDN